MSARRPLPLPLLFFTALVGAALAGCFGQPPEIAIGHARIGDEITFEVVVTSGALAGGAPDSPTPYESIETVRMHLLDIGELQLPDGSLVEAARIRTETSTSGGWNSTQFTYVDTSSLGVVKHVDKCSGKAGVTPSCTPVAESYDGRGSPWAFGSSLLHGRTIRSGDRMSLTEWIDGGPVVLQAFVAREGDSRLRVEIGPENATSGAPEALQSVSSGTLWIRPDSPYVDEAVFEWHLVEGSHAISPVRTEVTLLEYAPGDGPALVRGNDPVPWRECLPAARSDDAPLPPGSDYLFPSLNSSLREFFDQAKRADEDFRAHANGGAPYLERLRIGSSGGSEAPLTFIQRVDGVIGYPTGNGSARLLHMEKSSVTHVLLGQEVTYSAPHESHSGTLLPPSGALPPLVPVPSVAEAHSEVIPLDSVWAVELRNHLLADHSGRVVDVEPRLHLEHDESGGDGPIEGRQFTYSLGTGCLVYHSPGRLQME